MIKNTDPLFKRVQDSYHLFSDIHDLFEDPKKRIYLSTILSKDELHSVIEEFLICFEHVEDKEKILTVNIWKNIIDESFEKK